MVLDQIYGEKSKDIVLLDTNDFIHKCFTYIYRSNKHKEQFISNRHDP